MAAGMGWIPILGFVGSVTKKVDPGIPAIIKRLVAEEVLFGLSAFFVCAFLYYLLGDKSWLRPHIRKYGFLTALVGLIFCILILTGWLVYFL
jgi:hypothetical protein